MNHSHTSAIPTAIQSNWAPERRHALRYTHTRAGGRLKSTNAACTTVDAGWRRHRRMQAVGELDIGRAGPSRASTPSTERLALLDWEVEQRQPETIAGERLAAPSPSVSVQIEGIAVDHLHAGKARRDQAREVRRRIRSR